MSQSRTLSFKSVFQLESVHHSTIHDGQGQGRYPLWAEQSQGQGMQDIPSLFLVGGQMAKFEKYIHFQMLLT